MSRYPLVPLREVLTLDCGDVVVDPTATYRTAGIRSFGKGLFARAPVLGAETTYRRLYRLRRDQLVYSRLFAWEGAVALVTDEFDGSYVSPEFPTFRIDASRALPGYLGHIARWPGFHALLAGATRGLGLRRQRVPSDQLLSLEVPLPDVEEQRRIAAKLDRIASSREQLSELTAQWLRIQAAFVPALAQRHDLSDDAKLSLGWELVRLGDVMTPASDICQVQSESTYPNVGVLSFGRGLFEKAPVEGSTTAARTLNRIRSGQFIYSRLFAFEGAYAEVTPRFDGYFVSHEFPAFDLDHRRAMAGFIAAYLRSPSTWADLARSSKGLGVRRQRIHIERVLDFRMWLPPLEEQQRAVAAMSQLAQCGAKREVSGQVLAALRAATLNRAFAGLL